MDEQSIQMHTKQGTWCSLHTSIPIVFSIIIFAFSIQLLSHIDSPSPSFPIHTDITIEEGLTQNEITIILAQRHIVRSALYLRAVLMYYEKDFFIQAGTYSFDSAKTTREIAYSITHGLDQSPLIAITLPEGFRTRDLYSFLPKNFEKDNTITLSDYEGSLFPDTYFISAHTQLSALLELLVATYHEKLEPYREKITSSGLSEHDVITLASIIEREAKDTESKHIVSGILQNRLRVNMPLQVDATFDYILDKASHELTNDDLKIDSAYNTYTNVGLPPTPISNPGIESIEAVLTPADTQYLYYLTDTDGAFHYAKTFEQHKKNKELYLR